MRRTVSDDKERRDSRWISSTSTPIGNTPVRVRRPPAWIDPSGRNAAGPSTSATAEWKHPRSRAVWKPTRSYCSRSRTSSA